MNRADITTRASVLVERAEACAAGFQRLGKNFSADLTRQFARACRTTPELSDLYAGWIASQEQRLAWMEKQA